MMKNRKIYFIALVLIVLAAVFAVLHLSSREQVAENRVQLEADGKSYEISLSELALEPVSGVRVNGKGEEIPVEGQGIFLPKLLEQYPVNAYSTVTVTSDDSYSAQIAAEEAENACFVIEAEQLRLVVFGDSNSKRSVSNVKQITLS